jgi:hypothetical protein
VTRAIVVANALRYTVSPDDAVARGRRFGSLVQARVIDELSQEPLEQGVVVEPAGAGLATPAARRGARARAGTGGMIGILGIPVQVLPQLAAVAYELGLSARAPGYVARRATGTLGPVATFPAAFAPLDLGDLTLHREPVVIHGRTARRRTPADPLTVPPSDVVALVGTTVTVTGIWRTMPQATVVTPAQPPDLVAVEPPLYAERTVATGIVHTVTLNPIGPDKALELDASAGDTRVRLSNRINLAAPNVLALDEVNPDRTEHVRVTAVDGTVSDQQPATVTLAFPLAFPHRRGTVARRVDAVAPGADVPLATDAVGGDTTVFLAAGGFATGDAVEVRGGPAGTEYHRLLRYQTASGSGGNYRLPPLSRVAQVTIQAQRAPFPVRTTTLSVTYAAREQRVDFMLA